MTSMAKGSYHDVHGKGFPPCRPWQRVPTMTSMAKGSSHDVHEGFLTMTSMAKDAHQPERFHRTIMLTVCMLTGGQAFLGRNSTSSTLFGREIVNGVCRVVGPDL